MNMDKQSDSKLLPFSTVDTVKFQQTIMEYYDQHGRHDLPWRQPESDGSFDPYKILVSEIMLQQTQVARVMPKYAEFLADFPDVKALARSSLGEVLIAWSGLGYNRRAKYLLQAAQMIVTDFGGTFPSGLKELEELPGVGPNTAGAIAVYAYNLPEIFIETNIRTVFIHHFFSANGQALSNISDAEIRNLVGETLDRNKPRVWYWALMDYGNFLKRYVGNLNQASKIYAKQSKFEGSRRQLRGAVIRILIYGEQNLEELSRSFTDERLKSVLCELLQEGLIAKTGKFYSIQ
jgi:A/G-specific adenine glycosylase